MRCRWTIICQLVSWFNAYCLVRTYSTSVEASLIVLGVYLLLHDVFPPRGGAADTSSRTRSSSSTSRKTTTGDSILASYSNFRSCEWIIIAALCIAIRPSSALFWGATSLWYLTCWCPVKQRLKKAFLGIFIGILVLVSTSVLDRLWYQRWVLVPWNFFAFNLLHGGSELYGAHPWHWNISCGLPTVLTTLLPLVFIGLYRTRESTSQE